MYQHNAKISFKVIRTRKKEIIKPQGLNQEFFFSNIVYVGINSIFINHVYLLITKNLNPFNLSQYKNIFQYEYSNIFPEIYCSTERRGFDLKTSFHVMFKTYKDKKKMELIGKKPPKYEEIRNDVLV